MNVCLFTYIDCDILQEDAKIAICRLLFVAASKSLKVRRLCLQRGLASLAMHCAADTRLSSRMVDATRKLLRVLFQAPQGNSALLQLTQPPVPQWGKCEPSPRPICSQSSFVGPAEPGESCSESASRSVDSQGFVEAITDMDEAPWATSSVFESDLRGRSVSLPTKVTCDDKKYLHYHGIRIRTQHSRITL